MIESLNWFFTNVIRVQFLSTSHHSVRKWDIRISQRQHRSHFKASNSQSFKWNTLIVSLHLANFFKDGLILKCWELLSETFLWHFIEGFVRLVFLNVDCKLQIAILYHIEFRYVSPLQEPVPYCPITTGAFNLCSIDMHNGLSSPLFHVQDIKLTKGRSLSFGFSNIFLCNSYDKIIWHNLNV